MFWEGVSSTNSVLPILVPKNFFQNILILFVENRFFQVIFQKNNHSLYKIMHQSHFLDEK
jgi:hypothetical protein